jgi:hypothetical protein
LGFLLHKAWATIEYVDTMLLLTSVQSLHYKIEYMGARMEHDCPIKNGTIVLLYDCSWPFMGSCFLLSFYIVLTMCILEYRDE